MVESNTITIIAAINNRTVAEANLLRSPLLSDTDVQFVPAEGFASASCAYNYGIKIAKGDFLVFAHQDVYIPASWLKQVLDAAAELESTPKPWAVLGVVGTNGHGIVQGCSWSTGLKLVVGHPVQRPLPAISLDELILVVRKSSGLFFDENLPGWHLYGTDIVQTALARGLEAYVIHAPVIHNSLPVVRLDSGFAECYHYMRRKWARRLPIQTCCIRITRFGWPFFKKNIKQLFVTAQRNTFMRLSDPSVKARELGYE